jgi:hypothetical protein
VSVTSAGVSGEGALVRTFHFTLLFYVVASLSFRGIGRSGRSLERLLDKRDVA